MGHPGRPRKIRTPAMMARLWEEYKDQCDHRSIPVAEFSAKNSEFVEDKVRKRVTYTIEGFCVYVKLARSKFYDIYAKDPLFGDIVTRMREECEVDAREKFETGTIPPQLAGLWMGKYGYSLKADAGNDQPNELLQSLLDLERRAGL